MADINLVKLYQTAFGYLAPPYARLETNVRVEHESKGSLVYLESDESLKSLIGTPIFQPVTLDGVVLPNEPIVEIRAAKRIVRTEIDGMDGTHKELFSLDDYSVTIRGLIVQEDGTDNFPEDQVRQLRTICEKKSPVSITNKMANLFGVNLIAIESFEFPVREGAPSVQPYVIQAYSDKNLDIELRNG